MTLDVNNDLVVKSIARVNITNYQSLEADLYFSRSPKEYRAPTRFSKNIIELITEDNANRIQGASRSHFKLTDQEICAGIRDTAGFAKACIN